MDDPSGPGYAGENLAPIRRPFAVAITAAMPETHPVRGKDAPPVPLSRQLASDPDMALPQPRRPRAGHRRRRGRRRFFLRALP